jgi:sporulation protein YlmC with PRC-barrel domain
MATRKATDSQTFTSSTVRGAKPHLRARGLRHSLALALIGGALFAGSMIAMERASAMQIDAARADAGPVLAYADPMPERFGGMSDEVYTDSGEHELNDAWLGMSVVTQDGVNIGYVTDAFLDAFGNIEEIVVAPAENGQSMRTAVYVPARFAKLGLQAVDLTLTVEGVATLEPATDYALLDE